MRTLGFYIEVYEEWVVCFARSAPYLRSWTLWAHRREPRSAKASSARECARPAFRSSKARSDHSRECRGTAWPHGCDAYHSLAAGGVETFQLCVKVSFIGRDYGRISVCWGLGLNILCSQHPGLAFAEVFILIARPGDIVSSQVARTRPAKLLPASRLKAHFLFQLMTFVLIAPSFPRRSGSALQPRISCGKVSEQRALLPILTTSTLQQLL